MVAGLNIKVDIWQYTMGVDDEVGGAQPSGTVAYNGLAARLTKQRANTSILSQGYEVMALWNLTLQGYNISISERDEIEVVWPTSHPNYGQKFRVIADDEVSRRNPYGPLRLIVRRDDYSRTQQ